MSFEDDIDAMDADVGETLGEVPVTYNPEAGGSVPLVGMFDRSHVPQSPFEAAVDNRGPSVFLRGTEIAKLPVDPRLERPTLIIDGQTFQPRAVTNDGPTGRGRRLMLSEVG
jgi:hypothetical protein